MSAGDRTPHHSPGCCFKSSLGPGPWPTSCPGVPAVYPADSAWRLKAPPSGPSLLPWPDHTLASSVSALGCSFTVATALIFDTCPHRRTFAPAPPPASKASCCRMAWTSWSHPRAGPPPHRQPGPPSPRDPHSAPMASTSQRPWPFPP